MGPTSMELSGMVLLRRGWAPVWVCEVLGAELALHKMHAAWLDWYLVQDAWLMLEVRSF